MANKANPKQFAQLCRKLTVLSDLLIDTVQELEKHGPVEEIFKENLKRVKKKCEITIGAAYGVDVVANTTYLGQLSKKVDTLIRKNFDIKDLEEESHGGLGREADESHHYQGAM